LSFVGADVGGFVGCPEPELLASWMSLGAFQPFFRNHAAHDACAREPWVHGEKWEAVMRAAVERRYRLIPYLYTVFEESARTGQPILRPLWFEFADDPSLFDADTAFLVGPDLLVAPRLESGEAPWKVRLPAVAWYDTSSGQLYPTGGEVTVSGAEPVVFARAGSIVPQMPLVQQLSQPAPGQLILDVWSGPDCHGSVYWDDGESFGYEQGNYRRVALSCEVTEQGLTVTAHSTGSFKPFWTSVHVRLHGGPSTLGKARDEGGRVLAVKKDPEHQLVEFDLPGARTDFQITVGR
jgi:alpha-glucosidase